MSSKIQPLRSGDPAKFKGWKLEGLIGEGGQSTIYLAKKDSQAAALKMIRKEFLHNQKSVERFFTEIKNLELIDHPNIAKVLDVDDDGSFVAIEYIDGLNLEDQIAKYGPLNFEEWKITAQKLAEAIDYCHSIGIIHKDISPNNIMMGPQGPVLIDFGISYLEKDPRLTSLEETVGTPPFMSPEHFGVSRPKEMDTFGLGGTLIFAGTGHYPFQGTNSAEWKDAIIHNLPNFEGLTEHQILIISGLLYKNPIERLSLPAFINLLSTIEQNDLLKDSTEKLISKIKRESGTKLVRQKKELSTNSRVGRRLFTFAAIATFLAIGVSAFAIMLIQNVSTSKTTTNPVSNQSTAAAIKPTTQSSSFSSASPSTTKTAFPSTTNSSTISKSPSPLKPQASASPSSTKTTSPVLSSENFKVSAPVASNVIKDSIFGRAFQDGLHFWHIGLTNSKGEKVPAITSIQFRMIGYPNAGWMDVPFKLKTESTFGTVYAEVDDILFAMIFKEVKYCPEFRAVREEGGKITQIWEKGQPECANDYVP